MPRPARISQGRVIDDRDFDAHSLAVDCMQMHDDYAWDRFEVYPSARDHWGH
jgi:hypothetical protein